MSDLSAVILLSLLLLVASPRCVQLQPSGFSPATLKFFLILPSQDEALSLSPPLSPCPEGREEGPRLGVLDAVQLAVDHVNGNSSVLRDHNLTFTHAPSMVSMHQRCVPS